MELKDATMQIPLSTCTFNGGQLGARIDVKADGRAYLWLVAMSSDPRQKSILYNLDLDGLAELRTLVEKATAAVAELQADGRIEKLELRRE